MLVSPAALSRLRMIAVNEALTMFQNPGGTRPMTSQTTRAGGCFLMICILAGFPLGLAIGNPMKGILIGTGAGMAIAVLIWLVDRRR